MSFEMYQELKGIQSRVHNKRPLKLRTHVWKTSCVDVPAMPFCTQCCGTCCAAVQAVLWYLPCCCSSSAVVLAMLLFKQCCSKYDDAFVPAVQLCTLRGCLCYAISFDRKTPALAEGALMQRNLQYADRKGSYLQGRYRVAEMSLKDKWNCSGDDD